MVRSLYKKALYFFYYNKEITSLPAEVSLDSLERQIMTASLSRILPHTVRKRRQ